MSEKNNSKSLFGQFFGNGQNELGSDEQPKLGQPIGQTAGRSPREPGNKQTRKTRAKQTGTSTDADRTTLRIPADVKEQLGVMLQLSDKGQNEYIVGLIEKDLNRNKDRIEAYRALKKE